MDVSDVNKTANPASHPHRVSCGEAASLLHTIAFEKAFGDMHRQKCMECAKSLGSILTESQPDYDSKDKDNSGEPEAKESDGFPKGVNEETGEAPTSYNDRQDAEGDKDRAKAKEDEGQERMAGSIGKKDVKGLKNDTDLQTRQIEALTKSLDKLVSVL